jgi:hypothetical protein
MDQKLTTLALVLFLAACQTTPPGRCAGWKPLRPTANDNAVISKQLREQLLAHNETGADLCGWSPR